VLLKCFAPDSVMCYGMVNHFCALVSDCACDLDRESAIKHYYYCYRE